MYLQKENIPFLSQHLLSYLINSKHISIKNNKTRQIEINIAFILLNILIFNKQIDCAIYQIMLKKKISMNKFVCIRKNISNTWLHKENLNSIYFISLKIMSSILTSNYIYQIYVSNNIIQNSIIKILKYFFVNSLIFNQFINKSFKKGTLEWELIYSQFFSTKNKFIK